MKHTLRKTIVYRLFGERIFHPHIWGIDVHSLAGGTAVGLFIAFTPTIPFHMLLCTIITLALRVNLPVSLAACWVINPVTAVPVFLAAYKLGRILLKDSTLAVMMLNVFGFETRTGRIIEHSLYLWAGSLIFAAVAAVAGYIAIRVVSFLSRWLKNRVTHHDDRII